MNAADREWALAVIDLMCRADSHQRLDEIAHAVAVDLKDDSCYISVRASGIVRACGVETRKYVEDLREVESDRFAFLDL